MHLLTTEDNRTILDRATRKELERFAKAQGVDIPVGMPALAIRKVLRYRGITNIETMFPMLRHRKIGQMHGVNATNGALASRGGGTDPLEAAPGGPALDAEDAFIKEWLTQNMGANIQEPEATPGPISRPPAIEAPPLTATPETAPSAPGGEAKKQKPNLVAELRAECKRRGIKLERRDNIQTLKAKLGIDDG